MICITNMIKQRLRGSEDEVDLDEVMDRILILKQQDNAVSTDNTVVTVNIYVL